MDNYKEYYTSREAAKLLSVAVSTIQLWTKNGSLDTKTTAGGHRRIARQSIENMLLEQESTQQSTALFNGISMIVVEDNAQMARLYRQSIDSWQEKVDLSIIANGYEALIAIGNKKPDIIITDLLMPEMDGFQMIKSIVASPELAKSQVIVVTGLGSDEISAYGELPSNSHLFTKPIDFTALQKYLKFELALFKE